MLLKFTKMHGLGNDFMVIDGVTQSVRLSSEKIKELGHRHFGIGFDQLLLVEPPDYPDMDFRYRIFNADGNEVEQCGNGARCFARFVRDRKLLSGRRINVQTSKGNIELFIDGNDDVSVNMGKPELEPYDIPFKADRQAITYKLDVDCREYEIGVVSMGNPHAVVMVEDCKNAPVTSLGPKIQHHARFPEKCNVGFMEIVNPGEINLRVYERGVGETLACGTGACAAVVAGRLQGLLESSVVVNLPGGALQVSWKGDDQPVWMKGPATRVYEGQIRI